MSDAFQPMIDAIVRGVVAALANESRQRQADTYTGVNLPPDIRTKRRFNMLAKHVPGAFKLGQLWTVDRAAWHKYRTKKDKPRAVSGESVSVQDRLERLVSAAALYK